MVDTARDIVTQALKKSGVIGLGRAPSAAEADDALSDLNDMVAEWNTQRWLTWGLLDVAFTSTGANSYTVGPGGNFAVTPRPDRIESAYQRQLATGGQSQPIDTPLYVIPAREQYSRIALKTLKSFGLSVFLDTSYPTGILYPYPVPPANLYQIHLLMKNVIPTFEIGTELSVPPHYIAGMKFNLARRLRQAFGKGLKPDIELNQLAKNSLNVIINSNIQTPELRMPRALVRNTNNYNILSDQFGGGG